MANNRRHQRKIIGVVLLLGVGVFAAGSALIFITGQGAGRLISAGTYLDFYQAEEEGFGKYRLFFRRPGSGTGSNTIQDVANMGEGRLPGSNEGNPGDTIYTTGGGQLWFEARQPTALEMAARAADDVCADPVRRIRTVHIGYGDGDTRRGAAMNAKENGAAFINSVASGEDFGTNICRRASTVAAAQVERGVFTCDGENCTPAKAGVINCRPDIPPSPDSKGYTVDGRTISIRSSKTKRGKYDATYQISELISSEGRAPLYCNCELRCEAIFVVLNTASYRFSEGETTDAVFKLVTGPYDEDVKIEYKISDMIAKEGLDYIPLGEASTSEVIIPAGEESASISFEALSDDVPDEGEEDFSLRIEKINGQPHGAPSNLVTSAVFTINDTTPSSTCTLDEDEEEDQKQSSESIFQPVKFDNNQEREPNEDEADRIKAAAPNIPDLPKTMVLVEGESKYLYFSGRNVTYEYQNPTRQECVVSALKKTVSRLTHLIYAKAEFGGSYNRRFGFNSASASDLSVSPGSLEFLFGYDGPPKTIRIHARNDDLVEEAEFARVKIETSSNKGFALKNSEGERIGVGDNKNLYPGVQHYYYKVFILDDDSPIPPGVIESSEPSESQSPAPENPAPQKPAPQESETPAPKETTLPENREGLWVPDEVIGAPGETVRIQVKIPAEVGNNAKLRYSTIGTDMGIEPNSDYEPLSSGPVIVNGGETFIIEVEIKESARKGDFGVKVVLREEDDDFYGRGDVTVHISGG